MRLVLACLLVLAGCAAPPAPAPLRSTHANGFLVQDDGTLPPRELDALLAELSSSREKVLSLIGKNARPGDFRSPGDAACPLVPSAETRVVVLPGAGRCHADETGITIQRSHLARKDATHELTHYLAGGSWHPIDEGFAVYVTEKLQGPAGGITLDIRARVYMDLNLDDGLDRDRLRTGMSRCDYDLAGSFVKWLIEERGGLEPFFTLYRGAPGGYHDVYGVPEQELIARWREKIKGLKVRQDGSYYRFKDFMTR